MPKIPTNPTPSFPWNCPYCNRDATITNSNFSLNEHKFNKNNKDGRLILQTRVIVCPNSICKEYAISASLCKASIQPQFQNTPDNPSGWYVDSRPILHWNLRPQSQAKVFPSYIPQPILDDYNEACLISDFSPKASATLSRRCLQGMIRDFWKITKSRLVDEINDLQGKVNQETWEAIDSVRNIGNIGAHMEQDINIVIDVDPQEASLLISLIEMLLKEWYIAKHERQEQLKTIVQISEKKKQAKKINETNNVPKS